MKRIEITPNPNDCQNEIVPLVKDRPILSYFYLLNKDKEYVLAIIVPSITVYTKSLFFVETNLWSPITPYENYPTKDIPNGTVVKLIF